MYVKMIVVLSHNTSQSVTIEVTGERTEASSGSTVSKLLSEYNTDNHLKSNN